MSDERHDLHVSTDELHFLNQLVSRDELATGLLSFQKVAHGDETTIQLTRAEAEQLRDFLTTQLATVGFDENYSPNEQGRILEKLIDRFYLF